MMFRRVRFLFLVIVAGVAIGLLSPQMNYAQSSDLGQTFSGSIDNGSTLTFNYPTGWFVQQTSLDNMQGFNVFLSTDQSRLDQTGNSGLTVGHFQAELQVIDVLGTYNKSGQMVTFDDLFDFAVSSPLLKPVEHFTINGKLAVSASVETTIDPSSTEKVDAVRILMAVDDNTVAALYLYTTADDLAKAESLAQSIMQSVTVSGGIVQSEQPAPSATPGSSPVISDEAGISNAAQLAPITSANVTSLKEIGTLRHAQSLEQVVATNAKQNYLLFYDFYDLYLLDGKTGQFLRYVTLAKDPAAAVSQVKDISPDGHYFAAVGFDEDNGVFDATTGALVMHPNNISVGEDAAFSPDGKTVAFIAPEPHDPTKPAYVSSYSVTFYSLNSSTPISTIELGENESHHIDYSPDGHFLAVSSDGSQLLVIDTTTLKSRSINTSNAASQTDGLVFSPTDNLFVTFGRGNDSFHVWDAATGSEKYSFTQVQDRSLVTHNLGAAFSSDGVMIITAAGLSVDDPGIAFWDAKTGKKIGQISLTQYIETFAISPSATFLAVVFKDNSVKFYGVQGRSASQSNQPELTNTPAPTIGSATTTVIPVQPPTATESSSAQPLVSTTLSEHYTSPDSKFTFDYPSTLQINGQITTYPALVPASSPTNYVLEIWVGLTSIYDNFPQQEGCEIDQNAVATSVTQALQTLIDCTAADPNFNPGAIEAITVGGNPAAFYNPAGLLLINLGQGVPGLMRQTVDPGTEDTFRQMLLAIAGSVHLNETTASTPVPILHIGGQAQVYVEDEGLKLRAGNGTTYKMIENLPSGTVVTLIDGPKSGGGYTWWKVTAPDGQSGWVVEAADGIATLIPLNG